MFNQTLNKIIKRQAFMDQLTQQQIATIQTKEVFFKALEESPQMHLYNSDSMEQEDKLFLSPFMEGPAANLLKHILPAAENSYEQIEQFEARINLFNLKKLNQLEILKSMFQQQKQKIRDSGLKVSDFLQLYESQQMQGQQREMNDPLIKKIMTVFETSTKEYSVSQLLQAIIEGVSANQQTEKQEDSQPRKIRMIRESVCSMQGLNVNLDQSENQFNEQTKKEMDKIVEYYHNLLHIFDVDKDD